MDSNLPLPPPGFDSLSAEDQIEYVQALWDRIAASPEQVPVPAWHRDVIRERLAGQQATPAAGQDWEEVRDGLERSLQERNQKRNQE